MPYAVLQRSLEIPAVEKLKRAFRCMPGLVEMDAYTLAKDAFGILVREQEQSDAVRLQQALRAEGVETDVVDESDLIPLPPTKFVRRLDCLPEGLQVYDSLGRSFPVEWSHLTLVSAGWVHRIRFQTTGSVRPKSAFKMLFNEVETGSRPDIVYSTHESNEPQWMLEFILGPGAARLSLSPERAHDLLFAYLGERRTDSIEGNLKLFLEDIVRFAPGAFLNRGAHELWHGLGQRTEYPTRNAFYEEIVWLMWHRFRKTG